MSFYADTDTHCKDNLTIKKEDLKMKIATICGSTKFKEEMEEVAKDLTLKGYSVFIPHIYEHSGDRIGTIEKQKLIDLQLEQIALSDIVYILNKNNYIGEDTAYCLRFATEVNKHFKWFQSVSKNEIELIKATSLKIEDFITAFTCNQVSNLLRD